MSYLANALAIIGVAVCLLFAVGIIINGKQCAIALDQWLGTCLIDGHMADETISAWAHRCHHKRTERFINWLFRDELHCTKAYLAEMKGAQNAGEYRHG